MTSGFCGPGLFGRHRGGPFAPKTGARLFDSGALRLVVLAMIGEAPRHGYEIIQGLRRQFHGAYAPSPGSIYPMLKALAEAGLATSTSFGPRRRFSITEAGRAYLAEHRAELDKIRAQLDEAAAPMERESLGEAVRALRAAIFAKMRGAALSRDSAEKLRDILAQARAEIERL
jgi:DNA-binding PadR family transcriptional regulator